MLGRLRERVDAAGTAEARRTLYTHDAWDRVVTVSDPGDREIRQTYDERGLPLTLTQRGSGGAERVIRQFHDINGMVAKTVFSDGVSEQYDYDAWDRLIRVRGMPLADGQRLTGFTFGDDDRVQMIQTWGPDGAGAPDALLADHRFVYDERGRLVAANTGLGDVVTWYDADGAASRVVDLAGHETRMTYDAAMRPSRIDDAVGRQTRFVLDAADRVLAIFEEEAGLPGAPPHRREERRAYNARGELVSHTDMLGRVTTFRYDEAGRPSETRSFDGAVNRTRRNLHGEIVEWRRTFNGTAAISRVRRDVLGRVIEMTDPTGATTGFEFDDFDSVTRRSRVDGAMETFIYDAGGRLIEQVLASGTAVRFGYREDGEVSDVTVAEAGGVAAVPAIAYRRDAQGRLVHAVQGGSVISRRYDIAGRLVEDRRDGRSLQRHYDDVAGRDWQHFGDGRRDRYERDALDRVTSVVFEQAGSDHATGALVPGSVLARYRFSGAAPVRRELAPGVATAFDYDGGLRLTGMAHTDPLGQPLVSLDYGFDGSGRRSSLQFSAGPWPSADFAFDDLDHLSRVDVPGRTDRYQVDSADTREIWKRETGGTTVLDQVAVNARHQVTHLTRSDGLSPAVTTTFDHHADGAVTADLHRSYVVDALSRVREIRRRADNALLLSLDWDAGGRPSRISRPDGQSVSLHFYGDRLVEEVHSPSGQVVQHTAGLMPREQLVRADGDLHYPLQDARGSLLALLSDTGAFEERRSTGVFGQSRRFDAAGAALLPEDALLIAHAFGGMHYLSDVDLYIAGSRLFDPETGRFLQPDPLGLLDGPNEYAYCRHNPIDLVDSNGLWVEAAWDIFTIGVGVGSLAYTLSQDDIDWWAAGLDVLGIALDAAALIVPGVPGGASLAIRASRKAKQLGDAASAANQVTRFGRGVRYTQAAHDVTVAARGIHTSYEQAEEGKTGAALVGVGFSVIGIRGAFGRTQTALHTGRKPDSLFSIQGNGAEIGESGRIWGMTNGSVYASTKFGAGALQSGVSARDLKAKKGELIVFEFTDDARDVFSYHNVWGPFTALKGLWGNQYKTNIGDIGIGRFNIDELTAVSYPNTDRIVRYLRISTAKEIGPPDAHQALWFSLLRSTGTFGIDGMIGATPGLAGIMATVDFDTLSLPGAYNVFRAAIGGQGEPRQVPATSGAGQADQNK